MKLRSHIDCPAFAFQKYNARSELMGVFTVSALFDIENDRSLTLSEEQHGIILSDQYSEGGTNTLARVADFVPFRPATDVTALAVAYAPDGRAIPTWTVGLMVGGYEHVLRVYGERVWEHKLLTGWTLSDAKPTTSVPLTYGRAFGGRYAVPEDHADAKDVDIWNPVGAGLLHEDTPWKDVVPAPQIEKIDDPVTKPFTTYEPQGFAPIAPVWRFREQYAGTYDETWVKIQHPFLPKDFDPRFYNVAHPALQFDPLLKGNEVIRASNMFPNRPDLTFNLPSLAFGAVATYDNGQTVRFPLFLDGLHLELLGKTPQVRLTWRVSAPWGSGIKTVDVGNIDFAELHGLQTEAIV